MPFDNILAYPLVTNLNKQIAAAQEPHDVAQQSVNRLERPAAEVQVARAELAELKTATMPKSSAGTKPAAAEIARRHRSNCCGSNTATNSKGRECSIVIVSLRVAQSCLANGPGGYAYTDDPALLAAGSSAPPAVRNLASCTEIETRLADGASP